MNKDDLIKLGLSDEKVSKVVEAIEKLKNDIKERDTQLEKLKGATGDAQELKKQIEALQADNKAKDEAHADEIKQLKINNAVESAITGAKGKNAKAIKALLDLSGAELDDDGSVKGLKKQLEGLTKAEDSSFLFDNNETTNKPAMKGAKAGESRDSRGGVDMSNMTYSQRIAQINKESNQ